MENSVLRTIQAHDLMTKGDGVVVGLSGGADSSALLAVLKNLEPQLGLRLHAVHVNHQLRGDEALRDQHFSEQLCQRLGVSFEVVSCDVSAVAKARGISFEMAGRDVRYEAFEAARQRLGFEKIALAHHQGDQSETFMLRLIRGTGLTGLKGIAYKRDGHIVRPLLDQSRADIEAYCQRIGIAILTDSTNLEAAYGRNFVRLKLFTEINGFFGGDVSQRLAQTAALLAEDADYLDEMAEAAFRDLVRWSDAVYRLDLAAFEKLHGALQSRLIRLLYLRVKGDAMNLSAAHVRQILSMLQSEERKTFTLQGVTFEKSQGRLSVKGIRESTGLPMPEISVETVVDRSKMGHIKDKSTIYLDADAISGSLYLRHRQAGDYFVPSGMTGKKKLQDFLVDAKIPAQSRDGLWLLCDETHILWVVGYRQSETARVTADTRNIISVTLSEVVTHL